MYRVADMIKIPCWGHQDPISISFIYIVSINSGMTRAQQMGLVAGNCLSPFPPLYPILTSKLKHPEACLGNKCERYNPYSTRQVPSDIEWLVWLSPHLDSCFKYSLSTTSNVFITWYCRRLSVHNKICTIYDCWYIIFSSYIEIHILMPDLCLLV